MKRSCMIWLFGFPWKASSFGRDERSFTLRSRAVTYEGTFSGGPLVCNSNPFIKVYSTNDSIYSTSRGQICLVKRLFGEKVIRRKSWVSTNQLSLESSQSTTCSISWMQIVAINQPDCRIYGWKNCQWWEKSQVEPPNRSSKLDFGWLMPPIHISRVTMPFTCTNEGSNLLQTPLYGWLLTV